MSEITLFSQNDNYKLYSGSMLDMDRVIANNSIDSIVTDPPYELNFMGKGWDNSGIAFQKETWKKCFEVLKPGGYLLAFGGSRTFHRIAVAIEEAGFEIRDVIMWLYGSGFPKSMNIGLSIDKKNGVESKVIGSSDFPNIKGNNYENSCEKERLIVEKKQALNRWNGWGTALKPAYEPIIVARKPCEGSTTDNVLKYGVGGINIDECRVATEENIQSHNYTQNSGIYGKYNKNIETHSTGTGRFSSNVILTYDETDKQEVCGGMPDTKGNGNERHNNNVGREHVIYGDYGNSVTQGYDDSGSAARYFYCAKASKRDRDEGLDEFEKQKSCDLQGGRKDNSAGSIMIDDSYHKGRQNPVNPYAGAGTPKRNTHPTVKPTDLMQYLIRLVTPNDGTVLDPFNGSGSTGKAVMWENRDHNKNYKYIGIELTLDYLPIAKARIEYAMTAPVVDEKQDEQLPGQMSLFDLM